VANAVTAGIAAADVIGFAVVGERSRGAHVEVIDVLTDARRPQRVLDAMQSLLDVKTPSQYETWASTKADADIALANLRVLMTQAEVAFRRAEEHGWPVAVGRGLIASAVRKRAAAPASPAPPPRWVRAPKGDLWHRVSRQATGNVTTVCGATFKAEGAGRSQTRSEPTCDHCAGRPGS
jgi:hypothetical protein